MGGWGREDTWQGGDWQTWWMRWQLVDWAVPHSCMDKSEEQVWSEADQATQGSSAGKKSLKISGCVNLWGCGGWTLWTSWKSVSFARSGKFSFIICSNKFLISCSSSSSGTPVIQMLEHFKMSWRFQSLSSFFFEFLFLHSFLVGCFFLPSGPVSYTHLTLPTTGSLCRSRWSPYH